MITHENNCIVLKHRSHFHNESNEIYQDIDKRVKFTDQYESGYSTTTSSDEGSNCPPQAFTMLSEFQPLKKTAHLSSEELDLNHNPTLSIQDYYKFNSKKAGIDTSTGYFDYPAVNQKNKSDFSIESTALQMTPVSLAPSPTSPLYYDPLHLSNLSQSDDASHLDADRSASESSFTKKQGILKKTKHSKNVKSIHSSTDSFMSDVGGQIFPNDSLTFNYSSPVKHQSQFNPSALSTFKPIHPDKSPSPRSGDPHRKSAFTPVTPRKHRNASTGDIPDNANSFTPIKGPAVLDYVKSSDRINELGLEETNPLLGSSQPEYSPRNDFCRHPNFSDSSKQLSTPADLNGIQAPTPRKIGKMTKDLDLMKLHETRRVSESRTIDSCSSGSPTTQVEALTNDAVRLDRYLENASAKELKMFLLEQLGSKDPKIIKALSTLIPVTVAEQVESHCVRCHKNFNPNERSRCYMPHPERMVVKVRQDDEGADFVCQCCNKGFRLLKMDFYEESTNALLTGHCYSGHHTTDPESVDYRRDGGAAKSCEENGCVEFYV